jgi:hypothetical protein
MSESKRKKKELDDETESKIRVFDKALEVVEVSRRCCDSCEKGHEWKCLWLDLEDDLDEYELVLKKRGIKTNCSIRFQMYKKFMKLTDCYKWRQSLPACCEVAIKMRWPDDSFKGYESKKKKARRGESGQHEDSSESDDENSVEKMFPAQIT